MAKAFGVAFTIGAKVSSSVSSAFATVEQKIKNSRSEINASARKARTLQKALDLQAKRDEIARKLKATGGTDDKLRKELADIAVKYRQARAEAEAYGVSVRNWRQEHQEAIQTLEVQQERLSLNQSLRSEQNTRSNLRGRAMETVVPALAIAAPVGAAVLFESSMADATKTIEGMRAPTGELTQKYYEMETVIKKMGRELPLTHAELASLFAAGGQQGISSNKELKEFATMSAHMSVAFGMSQEAAADAIGGYRSSLGLSMKDTRSMLDLMNQYANTSSATEEDIAEVVKRVGGLGAIAGVSAKPMTALAATLTSMKVAPEVAATSIKNLMIAMNAGEAATKTQTEAFGKLGMSTVQLAKDMQKDAPAAILSVLEAIKKLPKDEQISTMKSIFGSESLAAIGPMLGRLDLVSKNLRIAGNESAYAGAMQAEFANRSKTTANNLVLMGNRVKEVGINIGTAMLPSMNSVIDTVAPMISGFADFASQNQWLVTAVLGTVAAITAFKIATIATMYTVSAARSAYLMYQKTLLIVTTITNSSVTAQRVLAATQAYCRTATLRSIAADALWISKKIAVTAVMGTTSAVMLTMAGVQKTVTGATWLLNAALSANPIGLIILGIAGLVAGMVLLYKHCEPVRIVFDKVFNFIGSKVTWVWDQMRGLADGMKSVGSFLGFGDEEEEETDPHKKTEKKNRKALEVATGVDLGVGIAASSSLPINMPLADAQSQQPLSLQSMPQAQGASGGTVNMNFSLNGISDESFATRVIAGLNTRKSDFESIISNIIHDAERVAYGS